MLSIKVEKEIKRENKILAGMTLRQLICASCALALMIIVWQVTQIPFDELVVPFCAIGAVFGIIGWFKKDGMKAEDYITKYAKKNVYQNSKLKYRTRNKYVKLYNEARVSARAENAKENGKNKSKKTAQRKKKPVQKKKQKKGATTVGIE